MSVEEVEKVDHGLDAGLVVVFSEGDEGQDEGVLHFDFVQEDVLRTSFDVGVEEEGGRDGRKEKHVQEDEEQEEDLEPLRNREGEELVVGEGVVAASHVDNEDHVPQTAVVVGEGVGDRPLGQLDDRVAH